MMPGEMLFNTKYTKKVERNTQYPKQKANPNRLTVSNLRGLVEHNPENPNI